MTLKFRRMRLLVSGPRQLTSGLKNFWRFCGNAMSDSVSSGIYPYPYIRCRLGGVAGGNRPQPGWRGPVEGPMANGDIQKEPLKKFK